MDILSNEEVKERIIHKARNIWAGKIKLELLSENANFSSLDLSLTREQVIRKVMNTLLYELTMEQDKEACNYWMELSLHGSTELLKEAFPNEKYQV